MNTEKREGIERIAEVLLYSDCEMDWEVARGKLRLLYLKKAKALWDAGIRDASGFMLDRKCGIKDGVFKDLTEIKPKEYEVENE